MAECLLLEGSEQLLLQILQHQLWRIKMQNAPLAAAAEPAAAQPAAAVALTAALAAASVDAAVLSAAFPAFPASHSAAHAMHRRLPPALVGTWRPVRKQHVLPRWGRRGRCHRIHLRVWHRLHGLRAALHDAALAAAVVAAAALTAAVAAAIAIAIALAALAQPAAAVALAATAVAVTAATDAATAVAVAAAQQPAVR